MKTIAMPVALQLAHDPEQLLGLVRVEAGRRLVEDQDPRRRDLERPRDGRHLLDRHRVGAERLGDVDLDVEARGGSRRPGGAAARQSIRPRRRGAPADEDVLRRPTGCGQRLISW